MRRAALLGLVGALLCGCAGTGTSSAERAGDAFRTDRLTAAESSGYRATMLYDEVVAFVDDLSRSPLAQRISMGTTEEGRDLPALVIADPPVGTPSELRDDDRVVFFAFGGIHSGEACGKEALLMLARDILNGPDAPRNRKLLDGAVLLVAPLYNADGNERVSPDNRTRQVGPELGMGQRPNVNGLDLNRDYMKLASAEGRSMARFLTEWDPHVVFDSHTTNGSYHRYTLTYDGALNPSGDTRLLDYTRHELLPEASARMEELSGFLGFFYGNFDREMTKWGTYSHLPRFGASYVGLRNRVAILSEAYAYASFEDRVLSTLAFARSCIEKAVEDRARIIEMCARADEATIERGRTGGDEFGIAHKIAKFDEPVVVLGYEMARPNPERQGVRAVPTEVERDYTVEHWGRFVPTKTVERPVGYLVPDSHGHVVEKLREHGIEVEELDEKLGVTVERFTVLSAKRASREYQNVKALTIETSAQKEWIGVGERWTLVRTAQPLGDLIVYLLEPESDDGLTHWGVVMARAYTGDAWPILRVLELSE